MSNGVVIWEGISKLDDVSPITLIAVGLKNKSTNRKTGKMIQTYILRSDKSPIEVLQNKEDGGICGDCVHNHSVGNRSCYVNVGQGPSRVYDTYVKGNYPTYWLKGIFKNRPFRFGTYGDPAAVPYDVWQPILEDLRASERPIWTGYTHAWKYCDPRYSEFLMASVDSQDEYEEARASGWRTFRVVSPEFKLNKREFVCPASDEGHLSLIKKAATIGKTNVPRLTCEECGACNGGERKSTVAIVVHGLKWKQQAFLTVKGATINAES